MSDETTPDETTTPTDGAAPHQPHIHIVKGNPTNAEVAALVAVLAAASGSAAEPAQPEATRWGLPVDKLRIAVTNHQRVTLQERMHMAR